MIGLKDLTREAASYHTQEMVLADHAAKNFSWTIRLAYRAAAACHRYAAELYAAGRLEEADHVGDFAIGLSRMAEREKQKCA